VNSLDKVCALRKLGTLGRNTRWARYRCIGDYHSGAYECEFVSPYPKSAGNVDARLFVLLQDWASHSLLSGGLNGDIRDLGHLPRLPTNRNSIDLLRSYVDLELADVYATNLFPFINAGRSMATFHTEIS
jgi:hypothetical protein